MTTRGKIIEELNERWDIEQNICSCEKKIKELNDKISAARQLTGISYGDSTGGSGGISDPTGKSAFSIVSEYEPSLKMEMDELRNLLKKRKETDLMIYELRGKRRQVVILKYGDRKIWTEVCDELLCSATTAKKIHREAVDILVRNREKKREVDHCCTNETKPVQS